MKKRNQKNRKGALDISFGWLFAIIAGAVILFLAIYFSTKLINNGQETVSAETGKQLGILLDPLETNFESSQTTSIIIPAETRIHNTCNEFGSFGEQLIQLDQKSFGKWVKTTTSVKFENKYIFSESELEGKKFYVFSKSFEFPFKVADLIYMTSSLNRYCFVNAPSEIENELNNLNQSNLATENCSSKDIKVCFGNGNCNITVDYNSGTVEKDGESVHFAGKGEDSTSLMYAAIFSNKDVYECQLSRLMLRLKELTTIYLGKELMLENKGCDNNLANDLADLKDMLGNYKSSSELDAIKGKIDSIEYVNQGRTCMLY
jgi:hypothetical protein